MDMLKPGGLSSSSKHFICHMFINTDYMFRSHSHIRSVFVWLGFTNVLYRSRARTHWLLSHHRGPQDTFTRHSRKELSQKSPLWKVAQDPQKMCQGTLPHTESSESLILKKYRIVLVGGRKVPPTSPWQNMCVGRQQHQPRQWHHYQYRCSAQLKRKLHICSIWFHPGMLAAFTSSSRSCAATHVFHCSRTPSVCHFVLSGMRHISNFLFWRVIPILCLLLRYLWCA